MQYQTANMDFKFLWSRVFNILFHPAEEWNRVVAENSTKKAMIKSYGLPLIVITSLASLIGNALFSYYFSVSIVYVIVSAIIVFIVSLFAIYLSALIVNELAPSFDAKKNIDRSFQLVIYSFTPYFLVSTIAFLVPPLRFIGFFGLYGIVLFWKGATIILKTPEDKKAGFVVVSSLVILGIIAFLYVILGILSSSFFIGKGLINIM